MKQPAPKRRKQTESKLQVQFVAAFRIQHRKLARLLFSIPNGSKLAGGDAKARAMAGKRLKDEGLRPGAPDLFLMVPSGNCSGLWIEMKTAKGVQRTSQQEFEADAIANGYAYALVRDVQEGLDLIGRYLESGKF